MPIGDISSKTNAIEFTTVHYKNNSFEFQFDELLHFEKTFFFIINQLPIVKKFSSVLGEVCYHQIGSVGDSIEINDLVSFDYHIIQSDYTGSYHIWITPPYHPSTTPQNFMEECATLANKFQLLEPLIAGHFTSPSIEAFGDDGKLARSSLRQFIGAYSNYGTTDISLLMGGPTHNISKYYVTEQDLLEAVQDGKHNAIYAYIETPIYNYSGKQIYNYDKLEERILTSGIYKHFRQGNVNSKPPNDVTDYYSTIFQKSKIRPIDNYLSIGPDIRTKKYSQLIHPLSDDWIPEYYKKDNKFIEVYVNYNEKKISHQPVYDIEKYKKLLREERIGIELRVFDHFPTTHLQQILKILSCITYQSYLKPYKVTSKNMFIHTQWWHNEMAQVVMKGFEYKPSYTYLKNISKELGISEIRLLDKDKTYTQIVLETIYRRLNRKYKHDPIYEKLKFTNESIYFESLNKKSWFNIFTEFLIRNPSLYRELKQNKNVKTTDVLRILGKQYRFNVSRIQKYIKNTSKKLNNKKI